MGPLRDYYGARKNLKPEDEVPILDPPNERVFESNLSSFQKAVSVRVEDIRSNAAALATVETEMRMVEAMCFAKLDTTTIAAILAKYKVLKGDTNHECDDINTNGQQRAL